MKRTKADQIMTRPVVHARPNMTIRQAIWLMRTSGVSGLPVVDQHDRLVGMITEGDIVARMAGPGGLPMISHTEHVPGINEAAARTGARMGVVEQLMAHNPITATSNTPVQEIARLMVRNGIKRVPIVDAGRLSGIVTRSDILRVYEQHAPMLRRDVEAYLRDDLRIDPSRLEVAVREGVVRISGIVDHPGDIHLIETFVRDLDGVLGLDTTGLVSGASA